MDNVKDCRKGVAYVVGKGVDIVSPYIPLFDIATKLIKEIIDVYDATQYNKNTCERLVERVIDAQGAIEKLRRTKKFNKEKSGDQNFYNTFQRFTIILEKIKGFEEELSKMGNFRKKIEAVLIKETFISLTDEFDTTMRDLTLVCWLIMKHREKKTWKV